MRRALIVVSLVAASVAAAAWVAPYTYRYEMQTCPGGANPGMCIGPQACTAGTCSGTAPTTNPNEGMLLPGVSSYRLRVCVAPAALSDGGTAALTLSGSGSMLAYWFDAAEGRWMHNPELDKSVTVSGDACQNFPDVQVGAQIGRVRYVASSVTVSDGGSLADGGAAYGALDVLLDGYGAVN